MSMMRWIRKNNKRIMVVVGCVLMVAFLLPAAFFYGSGERNPAEQVYAYYQDADGGRQKITQGMLEQAERELNALGMLGISEILVDVIFRQGGVPQLPGIKGVGITPILAVHVLLFGNDPFGASGNSLNPIARELLNDRVERSDWAKKPDDLAMLKEAIALLTGSDPQNAPRYYLLLADEARRAGIRTTEAQIEDLLQVRLMRGLTVSQIVEQSRLQQAAQLKQALGNYVAILRYGDMVSRPLRVSEPELRRRILEILGRDKVQGRYVTFHAGWFFDQIDAPAPAVLQEQFGRYKDVEAGRADPDNLFGFGYHLTDRVKVEYLKVDLQEAREGIEASMAKLPILERDKLIQTYWQDDKEVYVRQVLESKRPPDSEQNSPLPEATAQDIREARLTWERNKVWQKRRAFEEASALLEEAKVLSQKQLSPAALRKLGVAERAPQASDYAAIAAQLNAQEDHVARVQFNPRNPGGYIAETGLRRLGGLDSATQERKGMAPRSVAEILFQCAPLHKQVVTRLDEPPAELYEDIGPLPAERGGPEGALYLLRITAVDPARQPNHINDDGSRLNPAAPTDPNQENPLYRQVERDWKNAQAFLVACKEADRFAQADPNWVDTVAAFNDEYNEDPNRPTGRLTEQTCQQVRQQISFYQQMTQSNPTMTQSLLTQIQRMQTFLEELMRKALEAAEDPPGRIVLPRQSEFSCMVFEDLTVQPISQEEFLRRKPLVTRDLMIRNQEMMAVLHYNPQNIEKRMGYALHQPEDE
ncbi:MAG: hypothetical protein JW810_14340 [Sedimentisphaerales bacterium]|nr:hypothetical protein [Sedimentisphaerales bacterium]